MADCELWCSACRVWLPCPPPAVGARSHRCLPAPHPAAPHPRTHPQGYTLRGLKLMNVSKQLAETHYSDLSSKPFFGGAPPPRGWAGQGRPSACARLALPRDVSLAAAAPLA